MPATLTDAQLREQLKSSAAAYEARQNELNTRERQVPRTLDMMIEVMEPLVQYLTSLKVPAKVVRHSGGITLHVGVVPNVAGELLVSATPDFKLKITKRAIAPDGNIGTTEEVRAPSDFGAPHWRSELAAAITWMLGSYMDDDQGAGDGDGDDDDAE